MMGRDSGCWWFKFILFITTIQASTTAVLSFASSSPTTITSSSSMLFRLSRSTFTCWKRRHHGNSISVFSHRSVSSSTGASVPANITLTKPYYKVYYNDVYRVDLPPKHRFPMEKYAQVRQQVQTTIFNLPDSEKEKINCEFAVSPLATVEELETTHCKDYIQRFLKGDQTELEQRNVGFPWSLQGVDRSLSSVGGTLAAACNVCEIWGLQQKQGSPPWAAHLAGGTHHAFYDRGEGFSVFSDIAVAANVVLQRYPKIIRKILIVDLDVHQGNGNAVLFANNPNVNTFSIQCEGNYFSEKQKSDLDVELPIDCTDQTYLSTLNHWLKVIERQGGPYDLIFYQAGVDIIEHDRLGRMMISSEGVRHRNELVYEFADRVNVPVVICMGGGYPKNDNWKPIIDAHATVYVQAHEFLRKRSRHV